MDAENAISVTFLEKCLFAAVSNMILHPKNEKIFYKAQISKRINMKEKS